jgi:hypothetical protein
VSAVQKVEHFAGDLHVPAAPDANAPADLGADDVDVGGAGLALAPRRVI